MPQRRYLPDHLGEGHGPKSCNSIHQIHFLEIYENDECEILQIRFELFTWNQRVLDVNSHPSPRTQILADLTSLGQTWW